jgi:hypothetical protein
MDVNNVLAFLSKKYPDIKELIEKANGKFRFYTGFIKSDDPSHVTDTIIVHERHPAIVTGIKTLTRYPYFKFVWKTREEEDDAIISNEYSSIFETFNVVFSEISRFFPCVLLGSKSKPYKVIYDDRHNLFVIDLVTYKGIIIDKYVTWNRKVNPLDRNECIADVTTIQFRIDDFNLTVEEYVLSRYLTDYYKLLSIYREELLK